MQGVQVRLGYSDRARAVSERTVHPLGLVAKGIVWYLVADTDSGNAHVPGVAGAVGRAHRRAGAPPAGLRSRRDVAEAWSPRWTSGAAAMRVSALADPSIVGWMRGHFGTRLTVGEVTTDGRVALEIGFGATERAAAETRRVQLGARGDRSAGGARRAGGDRRPARRALRGAGVARRDGPGRDGTTG